MELAASYGLSLTLEKNAMREKEGTTHGNIYETSARAVHGKMMNDPRCQMVVTIRAMQARVQAWSFGVGFLCRTEIHCVSADFQGVVIEEACSDMPCLDAEGLY